MMNVDGVVRALRTLLSPRITGLLVPLVLMQLPAGGQTRTDRQAATSSETLLLQQLQQSQQSAGVTPLGSTVRADEYFVGPSDGLAVSIWMSPPLRFQIDVTPEATLIIPTVGEVDVEGLTLTGVKTKVVSLVKKRYLLAEVSVTLTRPRPIIVTVEGRVLHTGQYTLVGSDRADRAIQLANTPLTPEDAGWLGGNRQTMSRRHVIVRHLDGTASRADIVKYLAFGRGADNPYLREGDVIVVPERKQLSDMVAVYGEVNAPGRIEHVPGDMISDAVRMAQGFTDLAMVDSVEVSRLSEDSRSMVSRFIGFDRQSLTTGDDGPLMPGDRIVVRKRSDLRADYRVFIEGQVQFPGVYPITRDRTRISDVIARAGGFTEFASLKSSQLSRVTIRPQDIETERMMSFRGGIPAEDSLDYILETELRLKKEIVNVDFERLFTAGDSTQDIYLQAEDVISIPAVARTIYVFGQVVTPGHIPFVAGMDPAYYVGKAGGFTDRARQDDLRIIKSRTKQWLAADETVVEEGDYIWIPKEPDLSFAYYMTVASQSAAVLSVIVAMAAVIISLTD